MFFPIEAAIPIADIQQGTHIDSLKGEHAVSFFTATSRLASFLRKGDIGLRSTFRPSFMKTCGPDG